MAPIIAALSMMVALTISVDASEPTTECSSDFRDLLVTGDWERVDATVDACIESRPTNEVVEYFCISVAETIRSPIFTSMDENHRDRILVEWREVRRRRRGSLSVRRVPRCGTAVAEAWETSALAGDVVRTEAVGDLVRAFGSGGTSAGVLRSFFREYYSDYFAKPTGLRQLAEASGGSVSTCKLIAEFFFDEAVMGVHECPSTASSAAAHLAMIAIERYAVDYGHYPNIEGAVQAEALLAPVWVMPFPKQDAWGNPLVIHSDATGYEVRSLGADGVADLEAVGPKSKDSNADIVWTHEGQVQQHDLEVLP